MDVEGVTLLRGSSIKMMEQLHHRRGARVLIVEDNEINREIARQMLQRVGMQVAVAPLASDAFKLLEEQDFDLVLMDIQMPGMDGLDATRHIRRIDRLSHLPIVAMTAHAMEQDRHLSREAGMNDHLTKPLKPAELYQAVVKWVRPVVLDERRQSQGPEEIGVVERWGSTRTLPGINVEQGLLKLGGNYTLYHQLLLKFMRRNEGAMLQLEAAIAGSQFAEARAMVHGIRGVAANLGAEALFEKAGELESGLGTEGADIAALLQDFAAELGRVLNIIQQLEQELEHEETLSRALDTPAVIFLLQRLLEVLDSDLGRAMELSSELGEKMQHTPMHQEYEKLNEALCDFDMEVVRDRATKICDTLTRESNRL